MLQSIVVGVSVVDANGAQRKSVTMVTAVDGQRFDAAQEAGLQDVVSIAGRQRSARRTLSLHKVVAR